MNEQEIYNMAKSTPTIHSSITIILCTLIIPHPKNVQQDIMNMLSSEYLILNMIYEKLMPISDFNKRKELLVEEINLL